MCGDSTEIGRLAAWREFVTGIPVWLFSCGRVFGYSVIPPSRLIAALQANSVVGNLYLEGRFRLATIWLLLARGLDRVARLGIVVARRSG